MDGRVKDIYVWMLTKYSFWTEHKQQVLIEAKEFLEDLIDRKG